jgi:hypothetical protein
MAFVISGVKSVRSTVGRVADFCPICRDMRAFELSHIGRSAHLYGVALSKGDTLYFEATCQTCGVYFSTHERKYASVATGEGATLEHLLSECGPRRPEHLRKDLEQAERMRAGTLTPEERRAMMSETFEFLNEHARHRRNQISADQKTNGSCTTSILVFCGMWFVLYAWGRFVPSHPIGGAKTIYILAGIVMIGVVYTFWQIYGDTQRFATSSILPKLARALQPLHPTSEELKALHARFLKRKFTLARCLTAEKIERAILDGDEEARNESEAA